MWTRRALKVRSQSEIYDLYIVGNVRGIPDKTRLDNTSTAQLEGFAIQKKEIKQPNYISNQIDTHTQVTKIPLLWTIEGTCIKTTTSFDIHQSIEFDGSAIRAWFNGNLTERMEKRFYSFLRQQGVRTVNITCKRPKNAEEQRLQLNGHKDTFTLKNGEPTPLFVNGNALITSKFLQGKEEFVELPSKKEVDKMQMILCFNMYN